MLIVELAILFTRLVHVKNMVDSTAFSNLPGGQFTPESSGQFDPKWGGQFRPEQVVNDLVAPYNLKGNCASQIK
jgi:hypothetical protein